MTEPADILLAPAARGIPLTVIEGRDWEKKRRELPADHRGWADANGFKAQAGRVLAVPSPTGEVKQVLAGADASDPFALGKLSRSLPPGAYAVGGAVLQPDLLALGWCLESYGFGRYGKQVQPVAQLVCPKGVDREAVLRAARASWMVRDLVNTPASDMGPDELEQAARAVARAYKAKLRVVSGKALEKGFPMIHAVGRARVRPGSSISAGVRRARQRSRWLARACASTPAASTSSLPPAWR